VVGEIIVKRGLNFSVDKRRLTGLLVRMSPYLLQLVLICKEPAYLSTYLDASSFDQPIRRLNNNEKNCLGTYSK
jgi:hypothetical protein